MGGWSLYWQFRVQGRASPWTGYPSIAGPLTHTPTLTQTGAIHLMCTSLGCGRKPKYLEKDSCSHGENLQIPHRQWPQPQLIFFSDQCCNKMTLNKMMYYYSMICCMSLSGIGVNLVSQYKV